MTSGIEYVVYSDERDLPVIMELIGKDLSEPYSIYAYRYFLNQWPELCYLAKSNDTVVGVVISKVDNRKAEGVTNHTDNSDNKKPEDSFYLRGYIGMLAVHENYRKRGIAIALVEKSMQAMAKNKCIEVVLETEIKNKAALQLYGKLGFIRDKRLEKYYLNGGDAFRLKRSLEY